MLSSTNTPGFAVYADNKGGICSSVSSVVIDPTYWGFGNLSINQSECSASVPEPGILTLLGLGLASLGFARIRTQ